MCAQTTAGLGFVGEEAQVLDTEDIFTCSFANHWEKQEDPWTGAMPLNNPTGK